MPDKVHTVREVFTPSAPARVAFVERERINSKLVNAIQTPGKQVVVYGQSGSGKTTLLVNKLHQTYPSHLTSRCMVGVTFDQLVLDAFDQLAPYYVANSATALKTSKGLELATIYKLIQAKISTSTVEERAQTQVRFLPPQLTPQNLARLIGASGCCWVLEDFHKIDDAEKPKLSQLMKVFMDMSDDFPSLKVVALGAVDTARQVVDYDTEMKNRVAEIRVELMEQSEILEIIARGEAALNLTFTPSIKTSIANYSAGLASVCHHLCLNMCDAAGVTGTRVEPYAIPPECFKEAMRLYVEEASDSIKSSFDKALRRERMNKFDNAKIILQTLCRFGDEGASRAELLQKIRATHAKFPNSNLEHYLKKLQREEYGALIRFSALSNCYAFADPFYRVFAMVLYEESSTHRSEERIAMELDRLLRSIVIRDKDRVVFRWLDPKATVK
jgi:hypothetical protein